MRVRRAVPALRIRAAPPLPDTREYSWLVLLPAQVPACLIIEIRRDLLAGVDEALHGGGGFFKHRSLAAIEFNLDDALDALGTDHDRHADVKILDAILAVEPGGTRQHALLIEKIALRHRDCGRRRRVESRARLEQIDDFS